MLVHCLFACSCMLALEFVCPGLIPNRDSGHLFLPEVNLLFEGVALRYFI